MSDPYVQELWSTRKNKADPFTFVGDFERLFYNPVTKSIRVSDGETPGGLPIQGGSAEAIYSDAAPDPSPNGLLWFNPENDTLSVASGGSWIEVGSSSGSGAVTLYSTTEPPASENGLLWFNPDNSQLSIVRDGIWLALSGEAGVSGYSGFSGYSGSLGATGISGFSGYSGISGFSGYSGSLGATGISGFSGYSGISGFSGYSGQDGTIGVDGATGATGISGFSGYSGISGYSGQDGTIGVDGATGATGATGISGFSGYSGESGISGYSGQSSNIIVQESDGEGENVSNIVNNVSILNFDRTTGFSVTELSSGNALISLGSTFKTWEVNGQPSLVAVGEDTVEFIAGNNIVITTSNTSVPKSIEFAVSGFGNISNINIDGNSSNILYGNGVFSGVGGAVAGATGATGVSGYSGYSGPTVPYIFDGGTPYSTYFVGPAFDCGGVT